jgi:hypothetical protein
MASENETIADIVAEFREMVHQSVDGIIAVKADVIADRIEAAWKREMATAEKSSSVGGAAAMREALELLNQLFDSCVLGTHSEMTADEMDKVDELYFKTKAALAAPPRNCDVGTVEEQKERFERFCDEHWGSNGRRGDCCENCPIYAYRSRCSLAWAQMPYAEEGGAE